MAKKVFTSQKITLVIGGKEIRVQALVSPYGAKYVMEDVEVPDSIRPHLGGEIQVIYKNVPTKAVLVRETTAGGLVYNARFVNPSGVLVKLIERDVAESGLPSPWIRSLPRLSADVKHLPVPALAVVHSGGDTYFLNVKNFTLGGLLLEFLGGGLSQVRLGHKFEFDLVTNFGDKIPDLAGVVTHVTVEMAAAQEEQRRSFFGVKFLPMPLLSESKYRTLIREHVQGLKEGSQGKSP